MSSDKPVVIYGGGGHARVIFSILRNLGKPVLGFFDDTFYGEEYIDGYPVLGKFQEIENTRDNCQEAYIALGDNRARERAFVFLSEKGFKLPALIHPRAHVESDASIGSATVVCIGAILGTKATVGCGAIINTGASVDHESQIGDFAHLAPQSCVAGRTVVGKGVFVGMKVAIADRLSVGDWAVIGAGSVVLANVMDSARIFGVHN